MKLILNTISNWKLPESQKYANLIAARELGKNVTYEQIRQAYRAASNACIKKSDEAVGEMKKISKEIEKLQERKGELMKLQNMYDAELANLEQILPYK